MSAESGSLAGAPVEQRRGRFLTRPRLRMAGRGRGWTRQLRTTKGLGGGFGCGWLRRPLLAGPGWRWLGAGRGWLGGCRLRLAAVAATGAAAAATAARGWDAVWAAGLEARCEEQAANPPTAAATARLTPTRLPEDHSRSASSRLRP